MPLITVIVPVYKVEPYLRRCVDSILAQTFSDFELILVDDGSPDNCGAICDEYAQRDNRVQVIHQQNGGLSAARNAGLDWAFANSESEWISFIDSDDWVHPDFLNYLYRGVSEHNTLISACSFIRHHELTEFEPIEYCSQLIMWDEFYVQNAAIGAVAWNKLYKKKLFENLRYPIGRIHEDEFLTYKLLYKAGRVAWLALDLYFYFYNANGIMGSGVSLTRLDRIYALQEQYLFSRKHGTRAFKECASERYTEALLRYVTALEKNNSTDKRSAKGAQRECMRKLRSILVRNKKTEWKKRNWAYEIAFPHMMKNYHRYQKIKAKLGLRTKR